MADIVLMRFPIRNVTYAACDGVPYRTDAHGIVGVAERHVAQAEGVGAVRVEAPPTDDAIQTDAAAVTDATPKPKRVSTSKKTSRT